jgi:hypothetical protein
MPANAIYLDAVINTKEKSAKPVFKFQKSVYVKYPEGGKIAESLTGKDTTLDFSADSTTPGVSELITRLNDNLKSLQSNAVVTDLKISYNAHLEGKTDSAVIDYNVILTPTMTNLILREEAGDTPALIDSRWRGMSVDGPVVIHDPKLGDVDINSPIGFFKVAFPDIYSEISTTDAESFLSKDLLNSRTVLAQPLTNWLHLFDPLGQLVETEKFGYKGEKIPITTFSMGESSFREGQQREKVETIEFSTDKKYTIGSIQYQSIGVIQINGIVRTNVEDGIEYFGASNKAVQGYGAYSSGNFPVTIIYSMTGMAVLGTIGFFYWSNKRAKSQSSYMQTGIDPKYLRSITTSEAAGGYHTNRGEAELIGSSDYESHQSVYGSTNKISSNTTESLPREFVQESASKPSETRGTMPKGWKPES